MERELSPLEQLMRGLPMIEGAQLTHQFITQALRDRAGRQVVPQDYSHIPEASGFVRAPDVRAQPQTSMERIRAFLASLQGPGTAH